MVETRPVDADRSSGSWYRLALAAAVLAGAGWLALIPLDPPPAAGAGTPETAFSAARAAVRVAEIAREPRPPGTPGHARTSRAIAAALEELGLPAEVQRETVVLEPEPRSYRVARIENLLARVEGSGEEEGALLLVAHYDSVPISPGAADDASGVAALLETLRALVAGPPPPRDVIALFSDAEEIGLLGARAFAERHPWSAEVALVANFEARGSEGPVVLFETGRGTGTSLVRAYGSAAPRPVATSLAASVYRRLPHDTDFSIFRDRGTPGFNFALIGGSETYHSRLDDPSRLDPSSLQHVGGTALALARSDRLDPAGGGPPAVYFNLPPDVLVVYPAGWAIPLALLALAGIAAVAWRAVRRGAANGRAIFVAALLVALGVAAAWGLAALVGGGWAVVAAALAAGGTVALALRRGTPLSLGLGAGGWWTVLAVASAVVVPGTSHLFAWPLLFALAGLFLLAGRPRPGGGAFTAVVLCAVPALLLWVPTLALLGDALGPGGAATLAVLGTLVVLLLTAPVVLAAPGRPRWLPPVAAAAAALALLMPIAPGIGGPTAPGSDTLVYAYDADAGRGTWASFDRRADPWTSAVLGEAPRTETLSGYFEAPVDVLAADAPAANLAAPEVEVLSAPPAGGDRRRVELVVRSPRRAPLIRVELAGEGLRLTEVEGRPVEGRGPGSRATSEGDPDGPLVLRLYAAPPEGVRFTVETAGDELTATLADRSYELPEVGGLAPRPQDLQPDRFRPTDLTMVRAERRLHVVGEPEPAAAAPEAPAAAGSEVAAPPA